jgi:hypothetical protein
LSKESADRLNAMAKAHPQLLEKPDLAFNLSMVNWNEKLTAFKETMTSAEEVGKLDELQKELATIMTTFSANLLAVRLHDMLFDVPN